MTFIRMIKRQSLCSLLQLTHHPWWSTRHFLISFLSQLWHTWPGLLSPKDLLHPHQILFSDGEDALWDVVGEDSNVLSQRGGPVPVIAHTDDALTLGAASGRSTITHLLHSFFFSGTQSVGGYPRSTSQPAGRLVKVNPTQYGRAAKLSALIRQMDLLHQEAEFQAHRKLYHWKLSCLQQV